MRPGDELRVRIAGFDRILVVRQPISKRVGAVPGGRGRRGQDSPAAAPRGARVRADARPRRRAADQARAARHRQAPRARRPDSARPSVTPTSSWSSSQRVPRTAAPASVTRRASSRSLVTTVTVRPAATSRARLARRSRRRRMPRPARPRRRPRRRPPRAPDPRRPRPTRGTRCARAGPARAAGMPSAASRADPGDQPSRGARAIVPPAVRHGADDVRGIDHDRGPHVEQRLAAAPTTPRTRGAAACRRPRRAGSRPARGSRGR